MPNEVLDRRCHPRLETYIEGKLRTGQGVRHKIEITDISAGGCAIRAEGYQLTPGALYGVKIAGMEALDAFAAWTCSRRAGLHFARPLHVAVADHLARKNPPSDLARADATGEA